MVPFLWKTFSQFLKRLNMKLPYDPAIPLLGIYPKELKTGTQTIPTHMVTVAPFTILKRQKQPKYPSTDEWVNKI